MRCQTLVRFLVVGVPFSCIPLAFASGANQAMQAPTTKAEDSLAWLTSEPSRSIDACTDFYSFVNASWVEAHPAPSDRSSRSLATDVIERNISIQREIAEKAAASVSSGLAAKGSIEEKIGLLYQSALDIDEANKIGLAPINSKLAAIDRIGDRADLFKYLVSSFTNGDQQVFLFGAAADAVDAKLQIATARQGGLGLPGAEYYTDGNRSTLRDEYAHYIARLLTISGEAEKKADSDALLVLELETGLAKGSVSAKDARDPAKTYNVFTPQQANALTPHFDWRAFFAAHKLKVDQRLSIGQPNFFAAFDRLLNEAPLEQWRAYLRFHVLDDAAPYLSQDMQSAKVDFYGAKFSGRMQTPPRWRQALDSVNRAMGQALGQLYVAKNFSPRAKQQAEQLVVRIRESMRRRIQQLAWMSPQTKSHAIEKLDGVLANVGYPDEWRTWDGLAMKPGAYYEDMMAAAKYDYWYVIRRIGGKTDRSSWDMNPQTVNAYYSRSTNSINFPAAMLQPPFFFPDGDEAVNYGALGSFVGHELTHGFDENGRQFDGFGNKVDWWTEADNAHFEALVEQLVNQFEVYAPIAGKPELHVDGRLTVGENIADLGGLGVAYDALQDVMSAEHIRRSAKLNGFTSDQRFFMSYARMWRSSVGKESAEMLLSVDRHSPASIRVNGPISDMPQFAHAFRCKAGDAMVRPVGIRAAVW